MNLNQHLPGYESDSIPREVTREHAQVLVAQLREAGYRQTGSCVTRDAMPAVSMQRLIEGTSSLGGVGSGVIGPLALNGEVKIGNAIGIWNPQDIQA